MIYTLQGTLSQGGGGFTPEYLRPFLWLSDTGSDPTVWPDISGSNNHAGQSVTPNQPAIVPGAYNGRQARRFNGVDKYMRGTFPSVPRFSVLVVMRISAIGLTYPRIFTQRGAGNFDDFTQPGHYIPVILEQGPSILGSYSGGAMASVTAAPVGKLVTFLSTHTGAAIENFLDGLSLGVAPATLGDNGAEYGLGTTLFNGGPLNDPFTGDLCEVFVFPSVPDQKTRDQLFAWFDTKWKSGVYDEFDGTDGSSLIGRLPAPKSTGYPWELSYGAEGKQTVEGGRARLLSDAPQSPNRLAVDCGTANGTLITSFFKENMGAPAAMVLFRVQSEADLWQLYMDGSTTILYKIAANQAQGVWYGPVVPAGQQTSVIVEMQGDSFDITVNGAHWLHYADPFNAGITRHGIGGFSTSGAASIAWFDLFKMGAGKATYEDIIKSAKPYGWWRLNERSGDVAADSSGNGNHGTYHPGTLLGSPGINGDPCMEIKTPTGGARVGNFRILANLPRTVEMWAYTPDISTITNGVLSVGGIPGPSNLCALYTPWVDRNFYFDDGLQSGASRINTVNAPAQNNRWYHVVGVADNGRMEIWVDGVLVASNATHVLPTIDFVDLTIGYHLYAEGLAPHVYCRLADVIIYDRALTGPEIIFHRESRLGAGPETMLWSDNEIVTWGDDVAVEFSGP